MSFDFSHQTCNSKMRSLHYILSISVSRKTESDIADTSYHNTSLHRQHYSVFRSGFDDAWSTYTNEICMESWISLFTVSSFRALILFFFYNRMINKCSISNMNLRLYYKYELVNVIKLGYINDSHHSCHWMRKNFPGSIEQHQTLTHNVLLLYPFRTHFYLLIHWLFSWSHVFLLCVFHSGAKIAAAAEEKTSLPSTARKLAWKMSRIESEWWSRAVCCWYACILLLMNACKTPFTKRN